MTEGNILLDAEDQFKEPVIRLTEKSLLNMKSSSKD